MPIRQPQRRMNPALKDIVKTESAWTIRLIPCQLFTSIKKVLRSFPTKEGKECVFSECLNPYETGINTGS